jgi:AraC family transcriptional regulator
MSLWVHSKEQPMSPLTEQLVQHDLDDTRSLLDQAKQLPEDAFVAARMPGHHVTSWDGEEASVQTVLEHLIFTKEVWLAAIEGEDLPSNREDDPAALIARHDAVAPRWLAFVRDVDRRGGWDDRLIDALCDPPESFVISGVIAHAITYAAHRRQLARHLIRAGGHEVDDGDPINWLRRLRGEETGP